MRTVEEILSHKNTTKNIIAPDALVIDALRMMRDVNLSYLVVMQGEKFEGIFSERNYSRNVALEGKSSATCPVKEAMDINLIDVAPWQSAEVCINIILQSMQRYLPVMDGGKFKGVITIHDILRESLLAKEELFDATLAELLDRSEGHGDIY